MKIIAKGAEATIYKVKNEIVKDRLPKSYRHPKLDLKLRSRRTKSEAKLISKANSLIPSPRLLPEKPSEGRKIYMQHIQGKKLSENLEKFSSQELTKIFKQIGKSLSLLHNNGLIHGDLTTSNIIYSKSQVHLIDFGLGFHSDRAEDKAVDLHLISEALEAKHPTLYKKAFKTIINEYKKHSNNSEQILKRLEKVESRGRYKQQY